MRTVAAGLLFVAHACLATECITVEPERYGTLELRPVDVTGTPVNAWKASVSRTPTDRPANIPLERLPYGTWWVRIEVPGFRLASRQVTIAQPNTTLRVELAVGLGCATADAVLAGTVEGATNYPHLWIKAIPLRGEGARETPITRAGRFSISGLDPSDYILLITDGNRVLHQQTTQPDSKLVIKLSHTRK